MVSRCLRSAYKDAKRPLLYILIYKHLIHLLCICIAMYMQRKGKESIYILYIHYRSYIVVWCENFVFFNTYKVKLFDNLKESCTFVMTNKNPHLFSDGHSHLNGGFFSINTYDATSNILCRWI